MNALLPIIRRKRRPLLVDAAPPGIVSDGEPAPVVAAPPVEAVASVKTPATKHDQIPSKRNAH